ncbi:MAG: polyphosphate kinase 2 family protein [Anaerolineales bacterium]|nr:polyphosphate kinase 2 family protein [Anaerolineales bacterium]
MERYRVKPGQTIKLQDWDPHETGAFDEGKSAGKKHLKTLNSEIESLQELLYAEDKHKVLVVLQGMDTSGKDGTIRHAFEGVNPNGVHVANFKKPTDEELAHDYLWRVHKQVPAKGKLTIFNRSHYEDVLVVRVHNLVPPEVWGKRYDQINEFERMLAETGTTILKFYLHINKDEQKERLEARLDDPEKVWKFNPGDLKERALWDEYTQAYEAVLNQTSTAWAPWYIVPSNRKWYRNMVVATVVKNTLQSLNMQHPKNGADLSEIVIE